MSDNDDKMRERVTGIAECLVKLEPQEAAKRLADEVAKLNDEGRVDMNGNLLCELGRLVLVAHSADEVISGMKPVDWHLEVAAKVSKIEEYQKSTGALVDALEAGTLISLRAQGNRDEQWPYRFVGK